MSEAIFGFIGVIIGAFVSSVTTFGVARWSVRQQLKREEAILLRETLIRAQDSLRRLRDNLSIHLADKKSSTKRSELWNEVQLLGDLISRIGDTPARLFYFRMHSRLFEGTAVDRAGDQLEFEDYRGFDDFWDNLNGLGERLQKLLLFPDDLQSVSPSDFSQYSTE